ncbi:MAG: cytochrome P450 [Novosphingobium sp.]|nr:cytochrome P450 [Novosphingobium sp.]
MNKVTVDLLREHRRELFSPEQEARSIGMETDDPYPRLLALAARAPVQAGALHELMGIPPQGRMDWPGHGAYSLFSFNAVNQAFMDSASFTQRTYDKLLKDHFGDTLLNMDGDEHRRMRNIAKPHFKPSFAESWWNDKWIVQAVDELFGRIEKAGRAELNMEICAPLPVSVISIAFGLPVEEVLPFRLAIHAITGHAGPDKVAEGQAAFDRILRTQIALRRKEPRDDLISRIAAGTLQTGEGERPLSDDEVLRYCALIVFAGGGTTWRQMGITIFALLNNPEQFEELRSDRSLVRPTIHESTRWYPTDPVFTRWVAKDTAVEGVELKADSAAYLCVATANRDPLVWEQPDVFDIRRPMQRHFAFGAGIHACLGQHLSRQEMEVALNALLDRLPNLRWDPEAEPSRISGGTLMGRGPETLHVRFG